MEFDIEALLTALATPFGVGFGTALGVVLSFRYFDYIEKKAVRERHFGNGVEPKKK